MSYVHKADYILSFFMSNKNLSELANYVRIKDEYLTNEWHDWTGNTCQSLGSIRNKCRFYVWVCIYGNAEMIGKSIVPVPLKDDPLFISHFKPNESSTL